MPAMTPAEVKELVQVQLRSRKPIRAPWYRGSEPLAPHGEGGHGGAGPGSAAQWPRQAQQQQPQQPAGTGFFTPSRD